MDYISYGVAKKPISKGYCDIPHLYLDGGYVVPSDKSK